jgi:hypothetical protein
MAFIRSLVFLVNSLNLQPISLDCATVCFLLAVVRAQGALSFPNCVFRNSGARSLPLIMMIANQNPFIIFRLNTCDAIVGDYLCAKPKVRMRIDS